MNNLSKNESLAVTLSALESFPAQLRQLFEAVPAAYLNWTPDSWEGIPSESLTALGQICHVRDIGIEGYHNRFRQMLEEENPSLQSVDGYALVTERKYAEANPDEVFSEIQKARHQTLEMIGYLTEEQLNRTGFFEGYGRLNVKALIHYLSSHDQQHLSGLQWLLGKIEPRMHV